MEAGAIQLVLPVPPSANRYWRSCRGRTFVSNEAKAYKRSVALLCAAKGVKPLSGDVEFFATIYRARRRGDLDNFIKVASDALNGHAWADDGQIRKIGFEREDDKANPRMVVEVRPYRPTNGGSCADGERCDDPTCRGHWR